MDRGWQSQKGQSLILYGIVAVVLVAFVALAVDIGRAYAAANNLSEIVADAAQAGAQQLVTTPGTSLDCTSPQIDSAFQAAANTLAGNGYTLDKTAYTVNSSSCTGSTAAGDLSVSGTVNITAGKIPVTITDGTLTFTMTNLPTSVNYTFARVLGFAGVDLTRSAEAQVQTDTCVGICTDTTPPSSTTPPSCPTCSVVPIGLPYSMMNGMKSDTTVDLLPRDPGQSGTPGDFYRLNLAAEPNPLDTTDNAQGVSVDSWENSNCGSLMSGGMNFSCTSDKMAMHTSPNGTPEGTASYDYNLYFGYPGAVSVTDSLNALPGYGGANTRKMMQDRLDTAKDCASCGASAEDILCPVVHYTGGTGSNATYEVVGFAELKIDSTSGNTVDTTYLGGMMTSPSCSTYTPGKYSGVGGGYPGAQRVVVSKVW